MIISVL